MELYPKFVDAVCAIAQEMKVGNDLKRQELGAGQSVVALTPKGEELRKQLEPVELPANDEREKLLKRAAELGIEVPQRTRTETVRRLIVEKEAAPKITAPTTTEDVFDLEAKPAVTVTKEELQKTCAEAIDYFAAKGVPATPEETKELDEKKITEPDRRVRATAAIRVRAIVVQHGGVRELSKIPAEKYGAVVAALKAAMV